MNRQRMTSLVAAIALLLACAPLTLIYKGLFEWFIPVVLATVFVVGASMGVRALRGNALLQVAAMFGALLLLCTWLFGNGNALLGVIPHGGTFATFVGLLQSAGDDIQKLAIPVDNTDGLVFMAVLGIGCLAILTEVFTAIMREPTFVGIPLLTIYLIPVAILPESVHWLLFIPGAVGYLWLLMTDNIDRVRRYGRRFAGDGRGIDRWEPSPLATSGRWITAVVVPLAMILPMLLPGVTTGLMEGWYNGGGDGPGGPGGSGLGTKVDPFAYLEGSLDTSQTTEMGYVKTDNDSPGYMKMYTASALSDEGFAPDRQSAELEPVDNITLPNISGDVEGKEWEATFTATGLNDVALPLFSRPYSVNVGDDWAYDSVNQVVRSESATTKDLEYTYRYMDYEFTPDVLRAAGPVERNSQAYQANTDRPDSQVVSNLVDDLTGGASTQYDQVMSIYNHFSRANGFSYDLETGTSDGQSGNAIEEFLLTGKKGYCQQYAASMAWMVREADIPARVAIGLTGGTAGSEGYRLTNFNFHAWVEVYFEGLGWVPFDPTPAAGVRNFESSEWAPDPNSADNDDSDDSNSGDSGNPDDETGGDNPNIPEPGGPQDAAGGISYSGSQPPIIWPYWIAAALALAMVLLTPAIGRRIRRGRRLAIPPAQPIAAAQAAWADLVDTIADLRISVEVSETPRAVANRLIEQVELSDFAAAGLRHLAAAEEHARYSPRPPSGMTLSQALSAAGAGLAAGQPRMVRLRAELLPPSVLSALRRRLSRLSDRLARGMLQLRLSVSRRLPRRRSAG